MGIGHRPTNEAGGGPALRGQKSKSVFNMRTKRARVVKPPWSLLEGTMEVFRYYRDHEENKLRGLSGTTETNGEKGCLLLFTIWRIIC